MIQRVRTPRLWSGLLTILLLLGIGVSLVSAALPDDVQDSGYCDGDDDDAAVAPERLAVLADVAVNARAAVMPMRTPEAFEGFPAIVAPPIIEQSQPPLLRSPPPA
jgi:hypothetical protein